VTTFRVVTNLERSAFHNHQPERRQTNEARWTN